MKHKYIRSLTVIACLAVGVSVSSCADDAGLAETFAAPTVSIGTRSPGSGTADELIQTWRIFFVASDGTIADIVDGSGEAAESHEFRADLAPGTYKAYGFANIGADYWGGKLPMAAEGAAMPSLAELTYSGSGGNALVNGYAAGQPVPMAGKEQEITVSGRENQNFSIEVERMLAALQFTFRNETSADLTVRRLSFGPLTCGGEGRDAVYLLRRDGADGAPVLPAGVASATETYGYTTGDAGLLVPAGDEAGRPVSFYVMESSAAMHPTGRFVITLDVQRGNGSQSSETEVRYALTEKIRHIGRNDLIKIPIVLTDYVFDVPVWFYPPIGGYPPADIEQKSDDEFYCTFRSGGEFVMRPRIRRSQDGPDEWIDLNDRTKVSEDPVIEVSGDDIYVSGGQPRITATGEILGMLDDSKEGTSVVTFSVKLKDGAATMTERPLVRKIYIVKKKN